MKGVIARISPGTPVIDLTHDVAPQDVRTAAVALWMAYRYFPPGTIFAAIVDPGVGTSRRILAAETAAGTFLAPDNGLLTLVLDEAPPRRLVSLTDRRYWLPAVSHTFHGRDIFAPAAGNLAQGVAVSRLGPAERGWKRLAFSAPSRRGGRITGEILAIDRFGNALTNIPGGWVGRGDGVRVRGRRVAAVAAAYGDVRSGRAVAVVSSAATVEIAVNCGNAAMTFGLKPGDAVEILAK